MKIACAVVLYQPDNQVVRNVLTYAAIFKRLYLIDNSPLGGDSTDLTALTSLENTVYMSMGGNKGIAAALNRGLQASDSDGYPYLLTMDQDSQFMAAELTHYLEMAEKVFSNHEDAGVLGVYNNKERYRPVQVCEERPDLITSGMIIDVAKARRIGGFCEKLFIDFVDFEFCYHMLGRGYRCFRINNCCLTHQIGNNAPVRRFGLRINNQNIHSPVRFYYEFRNSLYVMRHYPKQIPFVLKDRIKILIKIVIVEQGKFTKLRYSLRGVIDALRGQYGAYR